MSWNNFKSIMNSYMSNPNGVKSKEDFAKQFTQSYNSAILTGTIITKGFGGAPFPIQKGNTELMEKLVVLACSIALTKKERHTFIKDLGKAVVGYWTGATLQLIPPLIPAPGSFQNIASVVAQVSNPGTWPESPPEFPTDAASKFLDTFITYATIHLTTIQATVVTTSLYPGFPLFPPSPGLIVLTGYQLPPATATPITPQVPEEPSVVMTEEDIEAAKEEAKEADKVANDTSLPETGRSSAKEYASLKRSEISSGEKNAVPVELSEEEIEEIENNTPEEIKCEVGSRIVAIAKRDIGILETGTPPGKNYGGFPGGVQKNEPGRIDDMFDNVGLDNQAKVRKDGSGYYWCAAAVATWWQEAGLETPSGGASCDNWMNWGKEKGYWSSEPKVGAAVLYGSPSDAHHIGIVAGVTPTGGIVTIEGNTSGGGFNRNGCGVFQKLPRKYLGFVNPPGC
jgi:hypothetical protein